MEVIVKDMKIDKNANDNIDNGGRIATATLLINNMFLIHGVTLVSGKNNNACYERVFKPGFIF